MASVRKPSFIKAAVRRYFRYNALRKGLFGQNKFWLTVFALAKVGGVVGKASKRGQAPVVFSESLGPGSGHQIVHIAAPPTRKQRRKANRASKKTA